MQYKKNHHPIEACDMPLLFAGLLLFSPAGFGAEPQTTADLVEEYKKLVAEQKKEFDNQRQIITEQNKIIEQMKSRLDAMSEQAPQPARRPSADSGNAHSGTEAAQTPRSSDSLPAKPVGQAPADYSEKPKPPELPRLSSTVGGVLTPKGRLVFEPSLQYTYTDNYRVFLDAYTFLPALAIGLIDIRQVKRHTMIGSLAARYGITDRWEVEFRAPFVYRSDAQRARPVDLSPSYADETFTSSGSGIGDLEFDIRYQLSDGEDGWPILIGNIVATVPTGTSPFDIDYRASTVQNIPYLTFPTEQPTGVGYFSFQPSITLLYPTDPGVFYGNIGYIYNVETNAGNFGGTYDAGDGISLSFGMGFSLNEKSSFSIGYSHKHLFNSTANGETINGSALDIGQLLIGFSFRASPKTTYNVSLGIGATGDSPSISLMLRIPMGFDI
ncbi:transporter [Methylomonas sp. SURF-2]|uniref:Transporter n=1 Tax=Methylomonas subterranea TaxID=2952225 RepID=A0ABT1TG72_9GAMM|nr:transporter [Methylomonas sp. SURF-2]MCQ8103759.1 transporter [Methylomonas sp. SURF-2]